jgi:hypothetical protein
MELRNIVGRYGLYDQDVSFIKKMGHKYKVVNMKVVRVSGLEDNKKRSAKNSVNSEKLENNIARSKSRIKEYALCNSWNYFCTLTIDKTKYDRYNLKEYYRDFSKFIRNYNRFCSDEEKVKYILIPEMHKNNAWHMHGLLKGIREKDIYINENGYLDWNKYKERFGFISLEPIMDIEKVSSYILKYLTKDISRSVADLGNHLYYSSKGLKTAELLFRGKIDLNCEWDYERPDGLCRIKYFDDRRDDLSKYIRVWV